jgi:hypothetical protein
VWIIVLFNFYLIQVKAEDRGVERATAVASDERVRIAASDTIESLLESDFRLIINDTEYYVKSPSQVSPMYTNAFTCIIFIITLHSPSNNMGSFKRGVKRHLAGRQGEAS